MLTRGAENVCMRGGEFRTRGGECQYQGAENVSNQGGDVSGAHLRASLPARAVASAIGTPAYERVCACERAGGGVREREGV